MSLLTEPSLIMLLFWVIYLFNFSSGNMKYRILTNIVVAFCFLGGAALMAYANIKSNALEEVKKAETIQETKPTPYSCNGHKTGV